MDLIHLSIFAVGIGCILAGVRMLYCGHQREVRHDRRSTDQRAPQ